MTKENKATLLHQSSAMLSNTDDVLRKVVALVTEARPGDDAPNLRAMIERIKACRLHLSRLENVAAEELAKIVN